MADAGPATSMNPTSTEHDYRFPRRPDGDDRDDEVRASLEYLHADLNRTYAAANANDGLLGTALFPSLQSGGPDQSLEQMQHDDPLATQVWKFFSQTKAQLPNQQRMENLTWRMMALKMRRKQQSEQNRYVGIYADM